ncbi:MAG: hypothetical protein AB7K36_01350 [Chloroflexota bacterium]
MKTTVYDWELHQGAAVDLLIPVTGLPTTGVGVRCHIRDSVDAVAPRLILAHDNPVNRRVTVSAEGIRIQIGATVTGGLQMAQSRNLWVYDVEVYSLTDADDVLKPRAGTVYAYKESTREADTVALPPLASGDGRYLRIDGDQGLTPEQQAWAQYNANTGPSGPGGASDHGALTGLADDDHPQYHNDARGDARYDALGTAAGAVSAHAAAPSAHPISGVDGLAAALALLAPLASPALTGTPTAPTALAGTANTQLATTAFVAAAIAALLNSAPGALDTLDELAAALGDDPNFATTVTNALAGKLAKASNLSDLTDAAAARTNLGAGAVGAAVFQAATAAAIRTLLELGGAAVLSVGTTAGTVAAGDDARLSDARTPTSHTHALGDITQSGAASGQVATWNGSAWVPQTPSGASPGGSGSELQYRGGASTFGGAYGTHWDAVNGRLSIGAGTSPAGMLHAQASAASVIPAVLQGAASQTAALQEYRNSAGTVLGKVTPGSSGLVFHIGMSAFIYSDNGSRISLNPSGAQSYGTALISSAVFELDRDVHFGFAAAANHATGADTRITRVAAGVLGVRGSSGTAGAAIGLVEQTEPGTPAAGGAYLYADDSGGKTRIMAKYDDGSTAQVSIQP